MTASEPLDPQPTGKICVIRLAGINSYDSQGMRQFEQALTRFIDAELPAQLVLDFSGVRFCSARMIGDLVKAKRRLLRTNGSLKLDGMSEMLRGCFQLLNLDGTVFDIGDEPAATIQGDVRVAPAGVPRRGGLQAGP